MSAKSHSPLFTAERWVLLVLVIASLLKIVWAASSAGSLDALLFYEFATKIDQVGLNAMYVIDPRFNHTPLTGNVTYALFSLTGGTFPEFAFALRAMGIVADIAVVLGLLQVRRLFGRPPTWALLLFAASPVSLIISGFHGNVDPVMIALMFFAAFACLHQRAVLSGVLFGLACNIKIVPILFAPVLFFWWLHRGHAWRFFFSSGAVLIGGLCWPLFEVPGAYLQNVFGYGGSWGVWGVTYWLRQSGWDQVQRVSYLRLSEAQKMIAMGLKLAMAAGIGILAWRRRSAKPERLFETLAGAWTVFFALVPGVGAQYMVWFAPFVLLLSAGWATALMATSTLYLVVFYQLASDQFPWQLALPKAKDLEMACAVANVTWLAIIALIAAQWRALWTLPSPEVLAESPTTEPTLASDEELPLPATLPAGAVS